MVTGRWMCTYIIHTYMHKIKYLGLCWYLEPRLLLSPVMILYEHIWGRKFKSFGSANCHFQVVLILFLKCLFSLLPTKINQLLQTMLLHVLQKRWFWLVLVDDGTLIICKIIWLPGMNIVVKLQLWINFLVLFCLIHAGRTCARYMGMHWSLIQPLLKKQENSVIRDFSMHWGYMLMETLP